MKTIGLIGGMSWESTAEYYRLINQLVRQTLGGQHSARILLYSVDFHEIEQWQQAGQWDAAADEMVRCAQRLERGGADLLVLCTNTMHKLAPAIEQSVRLPFLHIADATATQIRDAGVRKVGLLGTRYTIEQDFYRGRLRDQGLTVVVPDEADRALVNQVIYDELCQGVIRSASRAEYRRIMHGLVEQGVEGIILGCTEITLLVKPEDAAVPLFDTTQIHAQRAVAAALQP
ncbi:aspartate/glutamate racemase family protein [uncultured Hymenobacter sp.]|uniref:aspartate/glutamate racemase family protein n=1 Tax=uncultured Hymenobacter sp. TaxID=170016 RepID=UPI0035C9A881